MTKELSNLVIWKGLFWNNKSLQNKQWRDNKIISMLLQLSCLCLNGNNKKRTLRDKHIKIMIQIQTKPLILFQNGIKVEKF